VRLAAPDLLFAGLLASAKSGSIPSLIFNKKKEAGFAFARPPLFLLAIPEGIEPPT
jgi:hypothetical protein